MSCAVPTLFSVFPTLSFLGLNSRFLAGRAKARKLLDSDSHRLEHPTLSPLEVGIGFLLAVISRAGDIGRDR